MRFKVEGLDINLIKPKIRFKEYAGTGEINKLWRFEFKEFLNTIISSNDKEDAPGTIQSSYYLSACPFPIMKTQYPEFIPEMYYRIHKYFSYKGKYAPFPIEQFILDYKEILRERRFSFFPKNQVSSLNKAQKISGKITYFQISAWDDVKRHNTNSFVFQILGNDNYFKIEPTQAHSVSFALNIVIAYWKQEVIDFYFDKKKNKILYISMPFTMRRFAFELKLKNLISLVNMEKLSELVKKNRNSGNLSQMKIVNSILRKLQHVINFSLQLCYFIDDKECYWGYYSNGLNPDDLLLVKEKKAPRLFYNKFSSQYMKESIQTFIRSDIKAGVALGIVPEFIVDYTKKTIHYSNAFWHSKELNEFKNWTSIKSDIAPLIPEQDRYWIIDGKNWLHEIYGKEFSELFFRV